MACVRVCLGCVCTCALPHTSAGREGALPFVRSRSRGEVTRKMTVGEHQSDRHLSETAIPLSLSLSIREAGSLLLRVSPASALVYLASRLNRRLGGTHHRAAYVSGIHFSNEHERAGNVKVRDRQLRRIPSHTYTHTYIYTHSFCLSPSFISRFPALPSRVFFYPHSSEIPLRDSYRIKDQHYTRMATTFIDVCHTFSAISRLVTTYIRLWQDYALTYILRVSPPLLSRSSETDTFQIANSSFLFQFKSCEAENSRTEP